MKVSVVIPHFNGTDILRRCLNSVVSASSVLEVIVFDNGSSDDSLWMMAQEFPSVKVIRSEANYGYAGACHKAAKQCQGGALFFLNNDAWIAPNALDHLLQSVTNGADIVQPRILNPDGSLQSGLLGIDWLGHPSRVTSSDKIFYATGTALLIRRSVYFAIGGFDPDFFAFWEDIDLCWRARHHGCHLVYCDDAIVYHSGGTTIGSSGMLYPSAYTTNYLWMYFGRRNCLVTLTKNYRMATLLWVIPLWWVESSLEILAAVVTGNILILRVYWAVLRWITANRRIIWTKHKEVQRARVIGDLPLLRRMLPAGQRMRTGVKLLFSGRPKLSR